MFQSLLILSPFPAPIFFCFLIWRNVGKRHNSSDGRHIGGIYIIYNKYSLIFFCFKCKAYKALYLIFIIVIYYTSYSNVVYIYIE